MEMQEKLQSIDHSRPVSLEDIYRKYRACFVRYADGVMSDNLYAEDVVHDVFAKLFLGDYCFISELAALGFIYKALNNRCIDLLRNAQAMQRCYMSMEPQHGDMDIENDLEARNLYRTIEKHIATLPPQCRKIFWLKYKKNQSNPEIGKMLGLSVRTVENQVYIARNILRKYIDV